jgi:D-glycero-D-manno-heptose 1,7-bisphosphate phosphatase
VTTFRSLYCSRGTIPDPFRVAGQAPRKAIFLDRDGVINVKLSGSRYVTNVSEFMFLPGVKRGLAILKRLGYLLILITNQRGIARGFMTSEDLDAVHNYMQKQLGKSNVAFDAIYHCPHEEFEKCSCRKPEPGMILAATSDLNVDRLTSYMVGDSSTDVAAGQSAGVATVRLGLEQDESADLVFSSLLDFARHLERTEKADSV